MPCSSVRLQGFIVHGKEPVHKWHRIATTPRGFKTRQAAEQAYSDWVRKHGGNNVNNGKVGDVKVDRQFGLKLKNFIIFAQFIAIDVL